MPEPIVCPECGGARLHPHPAGTVVFQHRVETCELGTAQDATHFADLDRPNGIRPATDAEMVLWAAVHGRAVPPPPIRLYTTTTRISRGIVRRDVALWNTFNDQPTTRVKDN